MDKKTALVQHGEKVRESIVEGIKSYIQKHGYAPTVREIGKMVGLKSTSSVQSHLTRLFDEGKLETDEEFGSPRAIRVPGYRYVFSDVGAIKECQEAMKRQRESCVPKYLGENTAIGCRVGECKCSNIVRSYQNFCDDCGVRLEW